MYGVPFGLEVDLWSLGCILAELYTGAPLFFGKDKASILNRVSASEGSSAYFCIFKLFEWNEKQKSDVIWCTRKDYMLWCVGTDGWAAGTRAPGYVSTRKVLFWIQPFHCETPAKEWSE